MKACWGYFLGNVEDFIGTEESYQRLKVLCISARQYKKLYPEDKLVLYCNSQLCQEIFKICEGREDLVWDQIITLPLAFPKHDSSRFWVISQQLEPFVYIDADFWVVQDSKEELDQLKQAILTTPGFYLGHYRLNGRWNNISIASDFNNTVQEYLICNKGSSREWISACRDTDLTNFPRNHSIICGGTPIESYIVGTETLAFHKYLSEVVENREGYRLSLHEYASSSFAHLVGRVFKFNVSSDYVVSDFHLGSGGFSNSRLESFSQEEGIRIWRATIDRLWQVLDSESLTNSIILSVLDKEKKKFVLEKSI